MAGLGGLSGPFQAQWLCDSKQADSLDDVPKLISTLDKATRNIKGLASDLGLTVNSRMQMNMPTEDKENEHKSLREKYGIS